MTCLKGILEKCSKLPPVDVDDTGYGKIGILGKRVQFGSLLHK